MNREPLQSESIMLPCQFRSHWDAARDVVLSQYWSRTRRIIHWFWLPWNNSEINEMPCANYNQQITFNVIVTYVHLIADVMLCSGRPPCDVANTPMTSMIFAPMGPMTSVILALMGLPLMQCDVPMVQILVYIPTKLQERLWHNIWVASRVDCAIR